MSSYLLLVSEEKFGASGNADYKARWLQWKITDPQNIEISKDYLLNQQPGNPASSGGNDDCQSYRTAIEEEVSQNYYKTMSEKSLRLNHLNQSENEANQSINDILKEKNNIIDILKQEKQYYKDQLSNQNKFNNTQKQTSSNNSNIDEQINCQMVERLRKQIEDEFQQTIKRQQEIIEQQVGYIQSYDNKLIEAQEEIDSLKDKMGQMIKEQEKLLNQTQKSPTKNDTMHQDIAQIQMIEQLVKDKNRLTLEILQLKENNQAFKEMTGSPKAEDSTFKFYELFTQSLATQAKNDKLEQTFSELDIVFNHAENNDKVVLDELRRLSNHTLQQIFDLQKELTQYRALDGMSSQLVKLLKKSAEKNSKRHTAGGILSLEEQVMELNSKLKEQDKQLRQKEKKVLKKPSAIGLRKSVKEQSQIGDDELNNTQKLFIKSGDQLKQDYLNLEVQYQDVCQNLNKALDKIYEQDEMLQVIEKEQTLQKLEYNQLKQEYDRNRNEKSISQSSYGELQLQYDRLMEDKHIYEENLKKLNDQIQEIMVVIEEYQDKIEKLEQENEQYQDKANKVGKINEELRGLVDQERNSYQNEKQKNEDTIQNLISTQDSKMKLIKNKLMNFIQAELRSEEFKNSICGESMTFDEILTKISELLQFYRDKINNTVDGGFLNNTAFQMFNNTNTKSRDISPIKPVLDRSGFVAQSNDAAEVLNVSSKNVTSNFPQNLRSRETSLENKNSRYNDYQNSANRTPARYSKPQNFYENLNSVTQGKIIGGRNENSKLALEQNYNTDQIQDYATRFIQEKEAQREMSNPRLQNYMQNHHQQDYIPSTSVHSTQNSNMNSLSKNHYNYTQQGKNSQSNGNRSIPHTLTPSKLHTIRTINQTQNYKKANYSENPTPNQAQKLQSQNNHSNFNNTQPFTLNRDSQSNYRSTINQTQIRSPEKDGFRLNMQKSEIIPQPESSSKREDNIERKKSINDILSNFKKEKEHFNEKLSMLKSKLEQVRSPEPNNLNSIQHKQVFYNAKILNRQANNLFVNNQCVENSYGVARQESQTIENRRSKTAERYMQFK
ncbi:UNKNOWN [Stylonychia lemnae]|uniref:Uncharacterized protein n=1 Tax=Stylonychia lemnae TaxID=5949 RepID=A0A078AEY8_STYLE|nr:UNKNOWN [Stylonychia lemnae]|eukprot:CDW80834.1 UNKNOWN [Stylonychia lemnae]